jgi:hypothetical protein
MVGTEQVVALSIHHRETATRRLMGGMVPWSWSPLSVHGRHQPAAAARRSAPLVVAIAVASAARARRRVHQSQRRKKRGTDMMPAALVRNETY